MNDNLIQFLQEKSRFIYTMWVLQMKSWYFSKFILKLLVFSEEILNLNNLVAANRIAEKILRGR